MNIERILIIGGDSRINYLSEGLMEDGFKVKNFDGSEPLKRRYCVIKPNLVKSLPRESNTMRG